MTSKQLFTIFVFLILRHKLHAHLHNPKPSHYMLCEEGPFHSLEILANSTNTWPKYLPSLLDQYEAAGSVKRGKEFVHHTISKHQSNVLRFKISEAKGNLIESRSQEPAAGQCPVSKLQDLCSKHATTVNYEISSSGPAHNKVFTATCKIAENTALGQGRSKAQAKQNAAYNMMSFLEENNFFVNVASKLRNMNIKVDPDVNPISYLEEWSRGGVRFMEGDHLKDSFMFKCVFGDAETLGMGRTKKTAKKSAAFEMVKELRARGKIEIFEPIKNTLTKSQVEENGGVEREAQHHQQEMRVEDDLIETTQNAPESEKQNLDFKNDGSTKFKEESSEDLLKAVGREMGQDVSYRDDTHGDVYLSYASLSSTVTCFGAGFTQEEAKQKASRATLEYLVKRINLDWMQELSKKTQTDCSLEDSLIQSLGYQIKSFYE